MAHIKSRDLDQMTPEQRERRLLELKEELLQLRAQQALGGSSSNAGAYKQTRRSIARLLTKMGEENKE
ncbi:MAG: 50S ribosomal protein L29 [Euryarchaeota archaeon]|jgi:ribosomal protein L29|nr:50S ribosomal protein L29 [Euryarchaeota archaeon]MDC0149581.1 50S ribosomal protein L29 [Candidatus Poseidoniales archaeon]MDC0183631.1 50S ribosomal protein L29 [Candidatus Poseidoniales archaeon]MDP6885450.1 50S ribosomal protein L29 [Candidatus Thalassarchaeaceae archaeon]RCH70820.1 MAG: 50S ribosomal protein L29 [Candidatus Poseidoniales archaeon]